MKYRLLIMIRVILSIILGTCFGFFVHSYFLIDYFPIGSTRLMLSTSLASVVGSGLSFISFQKLISFDKKQKVLICFGLYVVILFSTAFGSFSYVKAFNDQHRYVTFLLPANTFEIQVPKPQNGLSNEVMLIWATTPIGDISFKSMKIEGWVQTDEGLRLINPSNNSIKWKGRTGDYIKLVFETSPSSGIVDISWNGESQSESLRSDEPGFVTIEKKLPVNYLASRQSAAIAGTIFFSWIIFTFCLLIKNLVSSKVHCVISYFRKWVGAEKLSELFQRNVPEVNSASMREIILSKWDWLLLAIILALAITLRVVNLNLFPPYYDEYFHLQAAKDLITGIPLANVYQRSLFLVTMPVVVFFKLFGMQVWIARLPGALFSAFAVLPLFFLMKRMGKMSAYIATVLYATSPFLVTFGRSIREYAIQPLIFFLVIYGMVIILERIPHKFVITRDWKLLFRVNVILSVFGLLLPVFYCLVIDRSSTFQFILPCYVVFAAFVLTRLEWHAWENYIIVSLFFLVAIVTAIHYSFVGDNIRFSFSTLQQQLDLLFSTNQQQWYFGLTGFVPLVAFFCAVVRGMWQRKHNLLPLFMASLLLINILTANGLFSGRYRLRYMLITELWFICLLAFGLQLLWLFLWSTIRYKWLSILIAAIAFASFFNISQILKPLSFTGEWNPISQVRHYQLTAVDDLILREGSSNDALIATVYWKYVKFFDRPNFSSVTFFNWRTTNPQTWFIETLQMSKTGWIVLDIDRGKIQSQPLPFSNFNLGSYSVTFRGQYDNQFVWYWTKVEPSLQN